MNRCVFATRFKELYKEKGWTQQDVATRLDYGINTIRDYCRKDGRMPPIEVLGKMGEMFDVDVAYLIGEQDCRRHADQTICDVTHLTEDAAKVLRELPPLFASNLSRIITNRLFDNFMELLTKYLIYADSESNSIKDVNIIEVLEKGVGRNWFDSGEKILTQNMLQTVFNNIIFDIDAGYPVKEKNTAIVTDAINAVYNVLFTTLFLYNNPVENWEFEKTQVAKSLHDLKEAYKYLGVEFPFSPIDTDYVLKNQDKLHELHHDFKNKYGYYDLICY